MASSRDPGQKLSSLFYILKCRVSSNDKFLMRKMNQRDLKPNITFQLLVLLCLFSQSNGRVANDVRCFEQEYLCKGGRTCIKGIFVCDGLVDCPQGDDEQDCHRNNISDKQEVIKSRPCDVGFYECARSDVCLPLGLICDGHPDCPYSDDELSSVCGHEFAFGEESDGKEVNDTDSSQQRVSHNIKKRRVTEDEGDESDDSVKGRKRVQSSHESTKSATKKVDPVSLMSGLDWTEMESQFNKGKDNHGNRSAQNETGIQVQANKLIPSKDFKPIAYSHTGSGYFFINFGNIVHGNDNVNGAGNDKGNGNGNGNGNGKTEVPSPPPSPAANNGNKTWNVNDIQIILFWVFFFNTVS